MTSNPIELLDHPADIGFRAHGSSLAELFANCAHALIAIILDPSNITPAAECMLEADGSDLDSLLVNWLNEVLYYVDTKRLVFASLPVEFPSPLRVRCMATGEARDPEKHPVRLSVKAVTYHQLKISNVKDRWMAEVYVDV
jgi:SHS2 domain-containing protein